MIRTRLGPLMYNQGKGELITRQLYRAGEANNQDSKPVQEEIVMYKTSIQGQGGTKFI